MMCTQKDCLKRKCLSLYKKASRVAPVVKNLPANAGDTRDVGLTPGLGRSTRERNGNSLQYFCLGSSMDREAWRAAVHGVTESEKTEATAHTIKVSHFNKHGCSSVG